MREASSASSGRRAVSATPRAAAVASVSSETSVGAKTLRRRFLMQKLRAIV
jgi:hypothetical protein